ncbi:hypothetical protein BIV57_19210 [Mangrovactinospora gilvigrisea]|uniref:Tyr recombinase domain-containing protein n=1 Tax=Mangrovactinospora gilvigrisea TaxID=1428644 RepID=A0A1J7C882_9ACTN|nr:tyrosine-type recombinase/integrase [Mangrovactinospora gilvigrisea]OIV35850.1 hypothetical protein BIV57_19210 [Mangrovactinospora gilvigrisea]
MPYASKYWSKKDKRWYYRAHNKLPNGRYGAHRKDENGQRFRTERSAVEYAGRLETDVHRKVYISPRAGKVTVRDWSHIWIDSIDVAPLTERDYRSRLRSVILPAWGDVNLEDITPISYSRWEKQLRVEGRAKNSIDGIRGLLRTMLDDAVASKMIQENPIPSRLAGRRGRFQPRPKDDDRVIATPRQALLIARNALVLQGLSTYSLVLTSAYCGLRIGELSGLTKDRLKLEDADGSGARILLEYQAQYVDGLPQLIPCKYDSGRGLILPPFLAELLHETIAAQTGEARRGKFVFTAVRGGRLLSGGDFYLHTWHPIVEGRPFRPTVRGAKARPAVRPVPGLSGMTPHGLRHSMKVWLDEAGHPRVAVEARMGHVLQGSEGVYSHVTLGMELKIAATLQELWEASTRPDPDHREYGDPPPAGCPNPG